MRRRTPQRAAKPGSTPPASRVQLWIMPTNEELIVARQTKQLLETER